jgi:hypothetical protein
MAFEDAPLEVLIGTDGERAEMVCLLALGRTAPSGVRPPDLAPLALETIALTARD